MENKKSNLFADAQYMTAREKVLVLKNWRSFLKHGLKKEYFTKRLYQHLHLHCGFIAHYNIHGFYSTYFEAGQDTQKFFETLCSNINGIYGSGEYHDLDAAMLEVYQEFKDTLLTTAEDDILHRLDVLEVSVMRARKNREFARELLSKIGL
jgi:hypothetical protein